MKLYATTAFVLASLAALSRADDTDLLATNDDTSGSGSGSGALYDGDAQDTSFNATSNAHGDTIKIKTAANLIGAGAKIQLCPSGDCVNGQVIMLSMSRLQEITANDDDKKPLVQEAKNFNALDAAWTPFDSISIGGIDALTSSFVTTFKVDKTQTHDTSFNLTAVIYQANGTAMNGKQTIDVPAGALKFSVMIKNWPFKDTANRLRFGVELKAQGKNKAERDPGTNKPKGGNEKHIDRLDMGEGMFMDAPTQAVVDGVNVDINASVVPQNKKLELVWVFPGFTESLYYDPVMGSEDASASVTDTPMTTPTTTTTTTTALPPTDGSGTNTPSVNGSGSKTSSTDGNGSATTDTKNTTATSTPTSTSPAPTAAAIVTPTPTPSETGTNTTTKTSGASVLGASVVGVLVAAAVGGTLFV